MKTHILAASIAAALAASAPAQTIGRQPINTAPIEPRVIGPAEALGRDAAAYARRFHVTEVEAVRRLGLQEASVPLTLSLQERFRDRLAGIVLLHEPDFRLVVLLTGEEAVPDEAALIGGSVLPISFRTGAPATRAEVLAAIAAHQGDLRSTVAHPPGMGADPRRGDLVMLVRPEDVGVDGTDALAARLSGVAGVPVEVRTWATATRDLAVTGGGRVVGADPATGRRGLCTGGFVVTDGARLGITTAAHCPDTLAAVEAGGNDAPLTMIGAWGARYQDVQIHVADQPIAPLFRADADRTIARAVTSWRNRTATRAGDFVCHRGERSGTSCSVVEFVDFAPPGDLCAGPCEPFWVAVRGPDCRSGDSGGPVYLGTIAFGLVKGSSVTADGTCRLFYYMSTDYLPPGWMLAR